MSIADTQIRHDLDHVLADWLSGSSLSLKLPSGRRKTLVAFCICLFQQQGTGKIVEVRDVACHTSASRLMAWCCLLDFSSVIPTQYYTNESGLSDPRPEIVEDLTVYGCYLPTSVFVRLISPLLLDKNLNLLTLVR